MDKPFLQNYDECLRYFYKTYDYPIAPGTVSNIGARNQFCLTAGGTLVTGVYTFPKPMAKAPTVIPYSRTSGAANSTNAPGAGVVSCTVGNIGQGSFLQLTLSSGTGVTLGAEYAQFTGDTGW
jgi:hypothetical protein